MTDEAEQLPSLPVVEQAAAINKRLRELEAEREAERKKRRDDPAPDATIDAWGY